MSANSETLVTAFIIGMVGLIGKIVWDWLNRNNKQNGPSPIVNDWGTITYLKTQLPQLIERIEKMTQSLNKIEEKTDKINRDNSVVDEKTGRKLIYVPTSLVDDMMDLKMNSVESNTILKQINDTLTRFCQINTDALSRQNQILTDLKNTIK